MKALKKKVLIVEEHKISRLKEALGVKSESEAVRMAVDEALHAYEMVEALKDLRQYAKRHGWGVPHRDQETR